MTNPTSNPCVLRPCPACRLFDKVVAFHIGADEGTVTCQRCKVQTYGFGALLVWNRFPSEERLWGSTPVETKPPLGQEPWRLGLPVITVQMLADFGQEGFFERTDEPKPGIDGVIWSQAAVDFACLLQGLRKDRLAVEPSESRAFTMKEAFGLTEKASERQCSWGCHYAGAQFIRYAACTVHGASSSENGSA